MTIGRIVRHSLVGLGFFAAFGQAVAVEAQTPLKVMLPFSFQGALSSWTLAATNGCYKRRGLDMTLDAGNGSGDVLTKVAAGAYDIGIADFTALVGFNAQRPEYRLVTTFIMVDRAPTSVVVLKSSGITKPADLAGKRIGDNIGEASRELFPALAKANGFDPSSISWTSIAPNLRQSSLVRGQYEAAAGHLFAITSGLRAIGVKDEDVFAMPYAEWGVDLYGNSVVVKSSWAQAHAAALKSFIACGIEGMKQAIADPAAAVASVKSYSTLLDPVQARLELDFHNRFSVLTPTVKEHGVSAADPARIDKVLTQVTDALKLAKPASDEVWTAAYLPPAAERMLAAP